jgi:hypothetical protein
MFRTWACDQLFYGQAGRRQFLPATPPSQYYDRIRDFVADLAGDGNGYLEIKETVEAAYGDKALEKMAIYAIINKVKKGETTDDQRHFNSKKNHDDPGSHRLCRRRH